MYREYLINVRKNKYIDLGADNLYIFHKNKIPIIMDILFLENKYKILIDNNLKR